MLSKALNNGPYIWLTQAKGYIVLENLIKRTVMLVMRSNESLI